MADVIARLRRAGIDQPFQPREKWHATIAFLGVTEPERYDGIVGTIAEAVRRTPAFDMPLDTLGAFPSLARPRVLWVGTKGEVPEFAACAKAIRSALEPLGYEFKDEAVAHVTLCRVKGDLRRVQVPPLPAAPAVVPVRSVTLYQSVPDRRTTRYVVRETFPLKTVT